MKSISIMLLGTNSFDLLSRLANFEERQKHFIHCFNVLDFVLPTEEEQVNSRAYRSELRRAFRLLKRVDTEIPEIQLSQLRMYDLLDLDDIDLEINAWIQQVFDNKVNYDAVYKFISGDLTKSNVELVPLISNPPNIVVYRGNKLAPLRYYYQKKRLLDRVDEPYFDQYSELQSDDLDISGHTTLEDLELNDEAHTALSSSDFLVILASDLVSLGVLSKMKSLLSQVQGLPPEIVLVLPSSLSDFDNYTEQEIFELLGLGNSVSKMIDHLSYSMDYIFSPHAENGLRTILLESGYQVENDEMDDPIPANNTDFVNFLLSLQDELQ